MNTFRYVDNRYTLNFTRLKEIFMRTILSASLAGLLVIMCGCGQKSNDRVNGDEEIQEGGNQQLYDEVMKVHDEVMPKMNDIYKLKEELKKKIATSPEIADEKKKGIESAIVKLDSASEGMTVSGKRKPGHT